MKVFLNLATIAAAISFSQISIAADGSLAIPVDVSSVLNANNDDVVLASCTRLAECEDGCESKNSVTACANKPIRFSDCGCDCGNWLENTVAFSGVEAFKTIGDAALPPVASSGYMNSAGFVNGLNTGFRLGKSKIRGQIGGSLGVYDLKGRDTTPNETASETQRFLTTGVFKRSNIQNGERLSWGVVYDHLWNSQYGLFSDDINLGQFRGIVGIALDPCNEVGFWGTAHTKTDRLNQNVISTVQTIDQYNLFWSHNFKFGARSMLYAGLTDHSTIGSWTTGAQLIAPMSHRVSLYGNSGFLFPSSPVGNIGSNEYLWSVSAGLNFSFGGKAVSRNISGQCGMPLQQVANNGTFMIGNKSAFD